MKTNIIQKQLSFLDEPEPVDLLEALEQFTYNGKSTVIEERADLRYFINEFWTARQRQSHRVHEVSYRACFKAQLPGFFIERLTEPGEVVYDPFMGRGTTLIEAALRGRVPMGNDINPLSKALAEPRLNTPSLPEISNRLAEIPWETFPPVEEDELRVFYHPKTLGALKGLRQWLLDREAQGLMDATDQWIRMVAINRLTGHSSGFFSVYTLPPNQAVSIERQRKINAKREQEPPCRDVREIIYRKSKNLLSAGENRAPDRLLLTGPADRTPEIPDSSVALTVTSPPFLDIVDYTGDNWLRCWFLGIDPTEVEITRLRKVEHWQSYMTAVLAELARITRPGGHIAFEVGEVRKGSIKLEDHVLAAAQGLPLEPLGVMLNVQQFTKTSNCWGVNNNAGGTNSNRIVLLRKKA